MRAAGRAAIEEALLNPGGSVSLVERANLTEPSSLGGICTRVALRTHEKDWCHASSWIITWRGLRPSFGPDREEARSAALCQPGAPSGAGLGLGLRLEFKLGLGLGLGLQLGIGIGIGRRAALRRKPTAFDHAGGVKRTAADMTAASLTADWLAYAEVCTPSAPALHLL